MQVWNPLYLYLTATWTNPNLTIASISKRLLGSFHTLSSYRNHPKPTLRRLRTVAGIINSKCSGCPTCSRFFKIFDVRNVRSEWIVRTVPLFGLFVNFCSFYWPVFGGLCSEGNFLKFQTPSATVVLGRLKIGRSAEINYPGDRALWGPFFVLLHHTLLWWLLFDPLTCLFSSKLVAFRFSELMMFNSCDFVWNIMVSRAWLWCVPFS